MAAPAGAKRRWQRGPALALRLARAYSRALHPRATAPGRDVDPAWIQRREGGSGSGGGWCIGGPIPEADPSCGIRHTRTAVFTVFAKRRRRRCVCSDTRVSDARRVQSYVESRFQANREERPSFCFVASVFNIRCRCREHFWYIQCRYFPRRVLIGIGFSLFSYVRRCLDSRTMYEVATTPSSLSGLAQLCLEIYYSKNNTSLQHESNERIISTSK